MVIVSENMKATPLEELGSFNATQIIEIDINGKPLRIECYTPTLQKLYIDSNTNDALRSTVDNLLAMRNKNQSEIEENIDVLMDSFVNIAEDIIINPSCEDLKKAGLFHIVAQPITNWALNEMNKQNPTAAKDVETAKSFPE